MKPFFRFFLFGLAVLLVIALFTIFYLNSLKNNYTYNSKFAWEGLSEETIQQYDSVYRNLSVAAGIQTRQVRTPAEWEEQQGILVAWDQFPNIQREIVRHAAKEVRVFVACEDSVEVKNYLQAWSIPLDSVTFFHHEIDRPWARDFGGNYVYAEEVDSLSVVDWHYNRPRPNDDVISLSLASITHSPAHSTFGGSIDLVHTGGNFMTDGFGTGFSSKIILEENPGKSPAQVDSVMKAFMGIDRYIKMDNLPYDGIHHIDMHMKLLDEETLLVGQFPEGVSDGPQIEANLQYITKHYKSVFGTPYKVVRIPMPPTDSTRYPGEDTFMDFYKGRPTYFTYTNSLIINKTILVPMFEMPAYDTVALNIYKKAMPGYNIVGIDCRESIAQGGAIHCLTKEVAAAHPLLISHQALANQRVVAPNNERIQDYTIESLIKHQSGIASAKVYYKTAADTAFQSVSLQPNDIEKGIWSGAIPAMEEGSVVDYYIEAEANSGKKQRRPMTAPKGRWQFSVTNLQAGF